MDYRPSTIDILTLLLLFFLIACGKKDDESTPIPAEMEISISLDPYGVNPLCARLDIRAEVVGKVKVEVVGRDGAASNIAHTFEELATEHIVPVLGLYPAFQNTVQVTYLNEANEELEQKEIQIITSTIPNDFPDIIVDVQKLDKMEPGLTLVSNRSVYNPNMPYMIDAFGKIRWLLDYSNYSPFEDLSYDVGIERLQNGNFYFADRFIHSIYEIGVYGQLLNSWPLGAYEFHHNVQEKPNGNFLATATNPNSIHLNGNLTHKDQVIEIDRASGSIIREWDLKESLDEYRTIWGYYLGQNPIDWAHGNAVIYDPSDNTIIVSCQRQGVFKLDENNKIVWAMGLHLGWGTNRQGDDLNDYLLTPLNASGNPITDADVLNGYTNHTDFEWNWFQHAPMLMPNGNIMLFDNGNYRNYSSQEKYSRAVEYTVDDGSRTIRQIWQYGKERGEETFSSLVSDVDYLTTTDNVLFSSGNNVDNGMGTKGGKIVEVNYNTKEVVFEVRISGAGFQFHRAERLSIYPK